MTRDEQIAKAVIEACVGRCRELMPKDKYAAWHYSGDSSYGDSVPSPDDCADSILSLSPADLVAALPKREPVAGVAKVDPDGKVTEWMQFKPLSADTKLYAAPVAQPDAEEVRAVINQLEILAEEYDPAPEGNLLTANEAIIDFLNADEVAALLAKLGESRE